MAGEGNSHGRYHDEPLAAKTDLSIQTAEDEHPFSRWFLLDGDRQFIAAALSATVFLVVVGLGLAGVVGVTESGPVTSAFASAFTSVFTLVTITVSINQLVLSRVIGSPGHIRDRVESVRRFREDAAELNSRVATTPSDPVGFLSVVTRAVREQALHLRETYGPHGPERRHQVTELTGTLVDLTEHVDRRAGRDSTGLYELLSPILNNSYSTHLNALQYVESETDGLSSEERQTIGDLADALDVLNLTRHYFKTLYIHEELAMVSRRLLLTGFPAGIVCVATILAYSGGLAGMVGSTTLLIIVSAAVTVVFVPFAVLFTYGLRLATVAARTTTFGTFTPAEEMP